MLSSRVLLRPILFQSKRVPSATASLYNSYPLRNLSLIPGVGKGKTSTGIAGLEVDHDAVQKLIDKNQALLTRLSNCPMPPTAQYYINLEAICRHRIAVATEHFDDPEKVEELIDCGQVEELVEQADNEMECLEMYLRERVWELVKPVEIIWDPVHDSVAATEAQEAAKREEK